MRVHYLDLSYCMFSIIIFYLVLIKPVLHQIVRLSIFFVIAFFITYLSSSHTKDLQRLERSLPEFFPRFLWVGFREISPRAEIFGIPHLKLVGPSTRKQQKANQLINATFTPAATCNASKQGPVLQLQEQVGISIQKSSLRKFVL